MAITVYGNRDSGSVIVEMAFELAGIPYTVKEIAYEKPGPTRDALFDVNPLGQLPAVVLEDGTIMTETLAILMAIDDMNPAIGLVPKAGEPERNRFLRWAVYLVAAVYPTYTYGDEPDRWVYNEAAAGKNLRQTTDKRREGLYQVLEAEAHPDGPFFFGPRFTAIDLYLAVMIGWRPGKEWFEWKAPRLLRAALAVRSKPELANAFGRG